MIDFIGCRVRKVRTSHALGSVYSKRFKFLMDEFNCGVPLFSLNGTVSDTLRRSELDFMSGESNGKKRIFLVLTIRDIPCPNGPILGN